MKYKVGDRVRVMLDGLVEDTTEDTLTTASEPTDAELIAAAELLKANCKNQTDCHKCIFLSNVCCKFEYKTPEEWELPHRKTRTEVVLEKFPNAEEASLIYNICPHDLGLNDNYPCCYGSDVECEACWNAPAESEEE